MRILFVSHYYPPEHTAGTETYAYNLAKRLKFRHEMLVFHTEKRIALPQYEVLNEEHDGIEKRVMINNRCYNHFGETYSNPKAEAAFTRVLDEFEPDIVHIHHLMYISLKLPEIAARRGIPVVMTLHDFFLACPRGGQFMLPDQSVCPGPEHERCLLCLSTFKYRQKPWESKMISFMGNVKKRTGVDLTKLLYFTRDKVVRKDSTAGIVTPIKGDDESALEPYLKERRAAVKSVFEHVNLFMTPSVTVGEGLKAHGLPREKLRLWKYGIDVKPFKDFERPERQIPVFAYLGTLMPHKGVHVFVEAATRLSEKTVKILVRGPGADRDPGYAQSLRSMALRSAARGHAEFGHAECGAQNNEFGNNEFGNNEFGNNEFGNDEFGNNEFGNDEFGKHGTDKGALREGSGPDILFAPGFRRSEVRHAFAEIDVLVLPSLWLENSPVVIQEAFACDCPVITSDLGGMKELVHDGENGRLFPPGDAKALAAIIEEAGRNPSSIESWRKGIRMPRTIEDDVEALEALYKQLSG